MIDNYKALKTSLLRHRIVIPMSRIMEQDLLTLP